MSNFGVKEYCNTLITICNWNYIFNECQIGAAKIGQNTVHFGRGTATIKITSTQIVKSSLNR